MTVFNKSKKIIKKTKTMKNHIKMQLSNLIQPEQLPSEHSFCYGAQSP